MFLWHDHPTHFWTHLFRIQTPQHRARVFVSCECVLCACIHVHHTQHTNTTHKYLDANLSDFDTSHTSFSFLCVRLNVSESHVQINIHHTNTSYKHILNTMLASNLHKHIPVDIQKHIPVGFSHFIDTPDAPAALRNQRLRCYIACIHSNVHTCVYICKY